jgi:hypothetical protein
MNRDICTTFAEQAINDNNESELRQKPGSGQAKETETMEETKGTTEEKTGETEEKTGQGQAGAEGTTKVTTEGTTGQETKGTKEKTKAKKFPDVEIKPRVKLSQGGRQLRRNSNSRKFMDK